MKPHFTHGVMLKASRNKCALSDRLDDIRLRNAGAKELFSDVFWLMQIHARQSASAVKFTTLHRIFASENENDCRYFHPTV